MSDEGRPCEIEVVRNVRVPTADPGVTLAATLIRPVDANPVPALVSLYPYLKDAGGGLQSEGEMRWFAARGYACLLVDLRGTGASDGDQRAPTDPSEADDGIAAIEWAAAQSWCTGRVGMWGMSYGAGVTLRTAAQAPAALRAILAIEGRLDVERDFVHPEGDAGCMGSTMWAGFMLYLQLLPPFEDYGTPDQTRRWLRRQHEMRPWLLDFARHGPGDPAWRAPATDAAQIRVPSFCVAGLRDLFRNPTVRAFEGIDAPKKLLFGPWAHSLPHLSPFGAIDFRNLALQWWDHWLRGRDNGAMDSPPVTLCFPGTENEWRQFATWPPASQRLRLIADPTGSLRPTETGDDIAVPFETSSITGALSGLYELPTGSFRTPLDQHEDDLSGTIFTGDPLDDDLSMAGGVSVTIRWADGDFPERLVAHLTDVDPQGRSKLIAKGQSRPTLAKEQTLSLGAVSYRVPAGHRLRLILSSSDFPRLWPLARTTSKPVIAGVALDVPVLDPNAGEVVTLGAPLPDPGAPAPLMHLFKPVWTIKRDLAADGIEVVVGGQSAGLTPNREHRTEASQMIAARAVSADPAAASVQGSYSGTMSMKNGDTVKVDVDIHATATAVQARGEIAINGKPVFSRQWMEG